MLIWPTTNNRLDNVQQTFSGIKSESCFRWPECESEQQHRWEWKMNLRLANPEE